MPRKTVDQLNNRAYRRNLMREATARLKEDDAQSVDLDREMAALVALMPPGHILPHDRQMVHTYLLLRKMYFAQLDKLMKGQNTEPMRATALLLGAETREFAKLLGLHKIRTAAGKVIDLLKDSVDPARRLDDHVLDRADALEKVTSGEPIEVGGKPGRGHGPRSILGLTLED